MGFEELFKIIPLAIHSFYLLLKYHAHPVIPILKGPVIGSNFPSRLSQDSSEVVHL